MKCDRCGADSRVLETREGQGFSTKRRRECLCCANRFTTVEVHEAVYCSAKPRAAQYFQTVKKRVALYHRDIQLAERLHEGVHALAAEFGITRKAVYLAASRGRRLKKEQSHEHQARKAQTLHKRAV